MKQRYLEVTFRQGKAFAAYLHLPHPSGARVVRTRDGGHGIKIDLDEQGSPVGLEITAPAAVLATYGVPALNDEEWGPLAA
jgi:uncharacterized protein YuzE